MTAPFVIATVQNAKGSTPRENGAYMLISTDSILGTIGGGRLEFEVINEARQLLEAEASLSKKYILGTQLNQCCGGQLTIDYTLCYDESHWTDPTLTDQTDFNIVLFGAGHVGQAVINVLATQPCQIHWIDSRAALFPTDIPDGVATYQPYQPTRLVADMLPGSYYLVMTHDHSLDLELCDHILSRGDSAFLGLIGSKTKASRFRRQLLRRGLERKDIEHLTCPIGIESISAKHPSSIALAVVAQLVGLHETWQQALSTTPHSSTGHTYYPYEASA